MEKVMQKFVKFVEENKETKYHMTTKRCIISHFFNQNCPCSSNQHKTNCSPYNWKIVHVTNDKNQLCALLPTILFNQFDDKLSLSKFQPGDIYGSYRGKDVLDFIQENFSEIVKAIEYINTKYNYKCKI